MEASELEARFSEPDLWQSTVVTAGVAIPHIRLGEGADIEMILVRARNGAVIDAAGETLNACFVLATPDTRRAEHLRVLAGIVRIVGRDAFMSDWLEASGPEALRRILMRGVESEQIGHRAD
jgi:mannitol/fructose-specific phosphotransferase system IIA component (Ntr-type)